MTSDIEFNNVEYELLQLCQEESEFLFQTQDALGVSLSAVRMDSLEKVATGRPVEVRTEKAAA